MEKYYNGLKPIRPGDFDMSNDPSLNSLDRFTKQSPRLVLETHGHCEAPAGCVGVVLRWRNPRRGVPAVISVAPVGEIALWIDGKACSSGRTILPFGDSVLALHLRQVSLPDPLLLTVGRRDMGVGQNEPRIIALLTTAADGTWRATTNAPGDDWVQTGFDDRAWSRLPQAAFDEARVPQRLRWHWQSLVRHGGVALALPQAAEIWVRKRFRLEETP